MDFLRYTFVVLEVVACCCGTWLRFMVLTFSSFLLSVSHRFSHGCGCVRCGLRCACISLFCHLLTRSAVVPCYWRRPRRRFSPSVPGNVLQDMRLVELESCLALAVYSSPAYMSQDESTRKFVRHITELLYYYFGFSTQRTIRPRYLTETPFLFVPDVSDCARKCCSSQGSLVKEIYVVRGTSTSLGTVHFFPVQHEVRR